MTDSAVSKRAWRAEFNLHRAKKSDRFDRACFLTCNDCAASDSTAMTDGARRDDIVRAIRSGNVAMNCDVSLVIASFARDLETSHASVMEIQGTRFESVVWKEFREHTTHPKVCEAAIEQLSMRDTRATRHPVVCTIFEFDLLFAALKLHAKNERIQRNGFELLHSSLLSMERSRAVHLGEERTRFVCSQMAFVVCHMFANLADSFQARFVAIVGINQLQRGAEN
jgi:hypothetical protein